MSKTGEELKIQTPFEHLGDYLGFTGRNINFNIILKGGDRSFNNVRANHYKRPDYIAIRVRDTGRFEMFEYIDFTDEKTEAYRREYYDPTGHLEILTDNFKIPDNINYPTTAIFWADRGKFIFGEYEISWEDDDIPTVTFTEVTYEDLN